MEGENSRGQISARPMEPGDSEEAGGPPQEALAERIWELLSAVPQFGRLLWRLSRDPRVPLRHKLVLAGAAGYVIMPFDLIPDRIPGLGNIDDFVVIVAALDVILNHIPPDVVESHWEGDPRVLDGVRRFVNLATQLRGARLRTWLLGDEG